MKQTILKVLDVFDIEHVELHLEGDDIQVTGFASAGFDADVIKAEITDAIKLLYPDKIIAVEVSQLKINTKESLNERQPKVQRSQRFVIRGRFRDSI